MASSSLVGTTSTVTFESGVEMTRGSSERVSLTSWSIVTPMKPRRSPSSRRRFASFSPIPAVKVRASRPPMTAV